MLPFRHDSLLGKAVKDAIGATKAPELSRVDARSITPGQEYVFVSPASSSDPVTQVPWTRRRLSVDLGEFISPSLSLFETTADATGVIPIVDVYTGENGNISQHFDDTPLFAVYSAKVYNDGDDTLFAALRVETQCSIWIGVDATGVADTVITTTPYADNSNAHTSAVLPLPTGWSEVDIGVYRQSGSMDFSITGDLAVQVAKIEAPDKTPPSDVSSLTQESWSSPHSVLLSWDWPTDSPDLAGAVIYKGSIAAANLRQTVLFDKTQVSCQVVVGGFTPSETATLYVRTFDSEGNYSDGVSISATSISGDLYFDSTAPATPTGLDATTGVTADALAKAWVKLTWNRSSEGDMARYIILKKVSSDSYYWALAAVSESATEMSFTDISVTNNVSYDYQLVAEDKSGNRSSATAAKTIVAGDVTGPADISDAYINGASKALSAAYTIAGQYAQFQWLNPSDTDLDSIRIYVTKSNTGTAAQRWASAQANDGIYATIPAKPAEYLTWDFYDKEALTTNSTAVSTWIFFVPVDKNGNPCATNPPKYFKLTFSAVVASPVTTTLAFATECNARGWWKADISVTVGYNTGSYLPTVDNYAYSWDGAVQSAASIGTPISKTTETTTAGSLLSARVYFTAPYTGKLTYGTAAQRLVKLDKTAPTAPTSPAATNVTSGVQISWADGADTISGLQLTQVYRNTSNATGGTLIGTVAPGTLSFIDTASLEGGRTYYYSIRHLDNADNDGTYSSVASLKIYPPEVGAHVNWLDNSGFERDDPTGAETFASWKDTGTPSISTNFMFGSRCVGVSSANKVTQEGIPLIGEYMLFSLYAKSGDPSPPKIQIALSFKDLSGAEVDTHTFETAAVTSSYARYSATSGAAPFLIAPTGSSPAATKAYDVDAATVDVTILTNGQPADVDGVLLQEVFWDGSTATSVETGETAPTTWFDSRVLTTDRINGYTARFLRLQSNFIVGNRLSSVSGDTYFDLLNNKIVLQHSANDRTELSETASITRTSNGLQWMGTFNHIYAETVSSPGAADADVSGTITIFTGEYLGDMTIDPAYIQAKVIYTEALGDGTGSGYRYNQFVVEHKAAATDYGNGYANFYIIQASGSSNNSFKVDYSIRVRGNTNVPAGYNSVCTRSIVIHLYNDDPFYSS